MARLIDADALENEVHTICREFIGSCRDFRTKCALYDAMKGVLVRIYDAPTLSPDEMRGVGEWKKTDAFPHRVYCSNCFKTIVPNEEFAFWCEGIMPRNYCPNCGAKMKGSDGSE